VTRRLDKLVWAASAASTLAALSVPAMWLVATQARGATDTLPMDSWAALTLSAVCIAAGFALLRRGSRIASKSITIVDNA
jgi:hypothetical protein